ncbi:MAG TPA: hypothetical protein VLG11_01180 [Candidatus Saccharimonadales bacterium]|nr:hypothetical protein [Candidatus Saccharimonadales bacterium]
MPNPDLISEFVPFGVEFLTPLDDLAPDAALGALACIQATDSRNDDEPQPVDGPKIPPPPSVMNGSDLAEITSLQ